MKYALEKKKNENNKKSKHGRKGRIKGIKEKRKQVKIV